MPARWDQAWHAALIPTLLAASAAVAQTRGAWVDPPAELSTPQAEAPQPSLPPPIRTTLSPSQAASSTAPDIAAPQRDDPGPTVKRAQPRPQGRSEKFPSGDLAHRDGVPSPHATLGDQAAQPTREIAPAPSPPINVAARQSSAVGPMTARERDARKLATNYLSLWSASNHRTLQATPAFYGSQVMFHGRSMRFGELLAEKRRFVQRWPVRQYRYRSGTMGVTCAPNGHSCVIRSTFDFDAANSKLGRRSRGVGTHELVVTFAGARPVIASETSRVFSRQGSP
jgi:hypothetical protein